MRVVDTGIVATGAAGTSSAIYCFPAVVRLANGDLLASFGRGRQKNDRDSSCAYCRSRDGGATWTEPVEPFDGNVDGIQGTLLDLYVTELGPGHLLGVMKWWDSSDPTRGFSNPQTEGHCELRVVMSESRDDGETWSTSHAIDHGSYDSPGSTGPVLKLPDGTLASPFETNLPYERSGPWQQHAVFGYSTDGGKTWPLHAVSATDTACRIRPWDQRPAVMNDGRIIDLIWTYDSEAGEDLPIHCNVSSPDGRSWPDKPWDTGVVGQISWPLVLGDRTVAMAYVDRYHTRSIRMCLSRDAGKTWDAASALVIYEHDIEDVGRGAGETDYLNSQRLWTFGLPTAALLDEHAAIVLYYAGDTSSTRICWAKVELDTKQGAKP